MWRSVGDWSYSFAFDGGKWPSCHRKLHWYPLGKTVVGYQSQSGCCGGRAYEYLLLLPGMKPMINQWTELPWHKCSLILDFTASVYWNRQYRTMGLWQSIDKYYSCNLRFSQQWMLKIMFNWVVIPCSIVGGYQHFREHAACSYRVLLWRWWQQIHPSNVGTSLPN